MSDELEVLAARAAWQAQTSPAMPLALDIIRAASDRFERRLRWRNAREFLAAGIVAAIFGANVFLQTGSSAFAWLARVGAGLAVVGVTYVTWYLQRHGGVGRRAADPVQLSTLTYLGNYRAELLRQSALLGSVLRWYLPATLIGPLLWITGRIWAEPAPAPKPWHGIDGRIHASGIAVVILLVVAIVVGWLNDRAARALRRRADALPMPE